MTTAPPSGAYDVLAPAYDLLTAGYAYGPWLEAIERLARSHGLSGRRALDVACGTGKSLEALRELGYDAIGCDASPGMAAVAREKLRGRAAAVHVADMRELPLYGAFDLVTCLDDALNHLPSADDVTAALRAIGANLAPGGLLAFDVNRRAPRARRRRGPAHQGPVPRPLRGPDRRGRPHALAAVGRTSREAACLGTPSPLIARA